MKIYNMPGDKSIDTKNTRVVKIGRSWNCYLVIDNQSFCVVEDRTKKEAKWYAKMLEIALDRLLEKHNGAETELGFSAEEIGRGDNAPAWISFDTTARP